MVKYTATFGSKDRSHILGGCCSPLSTPTSHVHAVGSINWDHIVVFFYCNITTVELLQEPTLLLCPPLFLPLCFPYRPFAAPARTVTRAGVCTFPTHKVAGRGSWAPTWSPSHMALTPRCAPTSPQSPSQIASSSTDPTGRGSWDWPTLI